MLNPTTTCSGGPGRAGSRVLVIASDALFGLAIALCLLAATARPAYAYVDPSVMTYTIQVFAGVAVAMGTVLGVVWRRARRWLLRMLDIDENAGKLIEDDVSAVPRHTQERIALLKAADEAAQRQLATLHKDRPIRLGRRARVLLASIVSVSLSFTLFIVAPLEIVAASSDSLQFGVTNVWLPLLVFAALFAATLTLVLSCFRGRAFDIAFAAALALVACCYLQAMLLNKGLPPADGSEVAWESFSDITLASALVWLGFIVACMVASLKASIPFKGFSMLGCVAIVLAQAIGLACGFATTTRADGSGVLDPRAVVTTDGLFEISAKENIVVFVLDTFDTAYLDEVLASYPDALDDFGGFTYYHNSVGTMIPTRYAMASLITGQELDYDDEAFSNSLIRNWYSQDNLLDELGRLGWSVDIYSADTTNGTSALADKTDNVTYLDYTTDFAPTAATLAKCALYRDLPWVLKPVFWFYTGELNQALGASSGQGLSSELYTVNDPSYYAELKNSGLEFEVETDEREGAFKLIHLHGAHSPYTMDETGAPTDDSTLLEQCRGSLQVVAEYIGQLKELGAYDSATIIVTADHGNWGISIDIDHETSPILLVKQAGADSAQPCATSEAPTGHVDLWPAIVDAAGGDTSTWGTPIWDVSDEPRTRFYHSTTVLADQDYLYTVIKEWQIDGSVLDFNNWKKTGKEWPIVSD